MGLKSAIDASSNGELENRWFHLIILLIEVLRGMKQGQPLLSWVAQYRNFWRNDEVTRADVCAERVWLGYGFMIRVSR